MFGLSQSDDGIHLRVCIYVRDCVSMMLCGEAIASRSNSFTFVIACFLRFVLALADRFDIWVCLFSVHFVYYRYSNQKKKKLMFLTSERQSIISL